jgi:alginate O-acetyltransferase complex protein AlgI
VLFLSFWFILFSCILFPLYWVVRAPRPRLAILLIACAAFHTHFAGPAGVLPIVVLAGLTYAAGRWRNRYACGAVIVLCVLALVFYKYTRFLCTAVVGAVSPGAQEWLVAGHPQLMSIAAPLAISFFVFEFVHYLADVVRGDESVKDPLGFALYAIFWPSIVAGPVKRYQEFLPELQRGVREVNESDVAYGLCRVAVGLVKKFIADTLTAYVAFWGPRFDALTLPERWLFVVGISLRILLDFSGYSDMAIGFARMHGIRLMENFNWPYLATSVPGFWHRWHISLSTWIRDYVYIALGGNRRGPVRKSANGLLAFAICGLWHGAGWNFLFWGAYHGAGLALASSYRRYGRVGAALARGLDRAPAVAWLLTMLFVGVGWLFFFYPMATALHMCLILFVGPVR